MPPTKPASNKEQANRTADPSASRPRVPADYGVPTDTQELLPWSHVTERMANAKHYWVCTVSSDGQPHATPVDGVWLEERLYFGGSPHTCRHRNLATNSAVCIHLENSTDVVILHGDAHELHAPDRALTLRLAEASAQKYGYAPKPEDYDAAGVYVFRSRVVFAWTQFPKDATRWYFADA